MEFTYEIKRRNLIIKLPKEIDHHLAEKIKDRIDYLIILHNIKNLIFDFSETEFLDSSGIGMIMGRFRRMKEQNGKVGLINVNRQLQKVFRLSGIYRLVNDYLDIQEAIKQLG